VPLSVLLAFMLAAALHDDADYRAAADRYRDLDYEQALFTFERLSIRPELTSAEKAEVLLWMALCYDGVGNALAAERMMNEALSRARDVQFPVKASPDILARLEALRAALPPEASPEPTPAPAQPAPAPAPPPAVPWLALAASGSAAVAVVGAGVLGVVSGVQWAAANDDTRFADERQQAHQLYTGTLVGAAALGVAGAALGGVAGYLWLTRNEP
jgi:hypothetical protein